MTATTETQTDTPAADIRARNKEVIFAALAEAGIHSVNVGYDGYSDSGQIDDIEGWAPLPRNSRCPPIAKSTSRPSRVIRRSR